MTYSSERCILGVPIPCTRKPLEPGSVHALDYKNEVSPSGKETHHPYTYLLVSDDGRSAVYFVKSSEGFLDTGARFRYDATDPKKFNDANIERGGLLFSTRFRDVPPSQNPIDVFKAKLGLR